MKKKEVELTIFEQIDELKKTKSYRDIVSLIDKEINNYSAPRENEGVACYQFFNEFDYAYYVYCLGAGVDVKPQWVNNKEVTLLAEKVDALIKSSKYDEAKEVVDTIIELAPSTAKYYLKKAEIYSLEEDVIEVEKMLMEARKYIWRSNEYAALLSYFSWIASIREDYIKSLYYAGASCLYNNALQVKNFANNVLTKAIEATGDTSLEVPNKEKVLAYFEENEEIYPTKQNRDFAYYVYELVLMHDDIEESKRQAMKRNLTMLTLNNKLAAKKVEVRRSGEIELHVLENHGFAFQASKAYSVKPLVNPNGVRLYELTNDKFSIAIEKLAAYESEEQYYATVDKLVEDYTKNDCTLVSREQLHIKEGLLTDKVVVNLSNGPYCIMYCFNISKTMIGRIYSIDTNPNSEVEREFISMLVNWEYLD